MFITHVGMSDVRVPSGRIRVESDDTEDIVLLDFREAAQVQLDLEFPKMNPLKLNRLRGDHEYVILLVVPKATEFFFCLKKFTANLIDRADLRAASLDRRLDIPRVKRNVPQCQSNLAHRPFGSGCPPVGLAQLEFPQDALQPSYLVHSSVQLPVDLPLSAFFERQQLVANRVGDTDKLSSCQRHLLILLIEVEGAPATRRMPLRSSDQ